MGSCGSSVAEGSMDASVAIKSEIMSPLSPTVLTPITRSASFEEKKDVATELRKRFVATLSKKIQKQKFATWTEELDDFPDGLIIMDSEGIILHANQATNAMFECDKTALIGNNILKLFSHKFFGKYRIDEKESSSEIEIAGDIGTHTLIGNTIYVKISLSRIVLNIKDEYYGFLVFLDNISLQKKLEIALSDVCRKHESILAALLPTPILARVGSGEMDIVTEHKAVIAFCDINISPERYKMEATRVANLKCVLFRHMDILVNELGITKIETAGDCYMVACGLFGESDPGGKIIRFGQRSILHGKSEFKLEMKFGAHYGEMAGCVTGTIPRFHLSGDAINIANRIKSASVAQKIHISEPLFTILLDKEKYIINPPRTIILKKHGPIRTYIIETVI